MEIKDSKIALVHDWFLKKSFGGSEKVTVILNELLNSKYSKPDVFSLTQNIENSKKNSFLKRIFIKLSRKLGFEIIDQNTFKIVTLDKKINDEISVIGKNSINLPLGPSVNKSMFPFGCCRIFLNLWFSS